MLDLNKLKLLKAVGYLFLIVLAVVIGVGIGQSTSDKGKSISKSDVNQVSSNDRINPKKVEEFLLNYFTKKDLGENRKRYKEFMTAGLYQQEVAREEEPISQTYKGFVVDFKYKSSEIYINQNKHSVIAQVNYVNTLLDEKKNYETAQRDVMNKLTLRLTYVNESGQLKLNQIESIILTDQTGDYGILDNLSTTEEESTETTSEIQETTEASTEETT